MLVEGASSIDMASADEAGGGREITAAGLHSMGFAAVWKGGKRSVMKINHKESKSARSRLEEGSEGTYGFKEGSLEISLQNDLGARDLDNILYSSV
jgi:hypothetical protein